MTIEKLMKGYPSICCIYTTNTDGNIVWFYCNSTTWWLVYTRGVLAVGAYSVLVFMTQRLLWPLTRLGNL